MQTLRVEGLTKTYGEKTLFEDLNFIINEHDRIGLIGTNGSGKTTIIKLLLKLYEPDKGGIYIARERGRCSIALARFFDTRSE